MKHTISITAILISLMIQGLLLFPGHAFSEPKHEAEYIQLQNAGDYKAALAYIARTAPADRDPAARETALFRIAELARFPELCDDALEALKGIAASASEPDLFQSDRIDHIRTALLLRKGDIKSAESVQKGLAFMSFQVIGPFARSSREQFEKTYPPELGFDPNQTCRGMFGAVSWFTAAPDRTGTINMNDLLPDVKNTFFYFRRSIHIREPGNYYLICGKTGYTDLWLDGKRIFSDRIEHGFCHDQYYILVNLPAGDHRILIKTADSDEGVQICLRLASVRGERIPSGPGDAASSAPSASGTVRCITTIPSLALLTARKELSPEELFYAGYLLLQSRLGNHEHNRGLKFLSRIPERHPLYSAACRYMAIAHRDVESQDRFFRKSIQADPLNVESLRDLCCLKISRSFVYEASPLIAQLRKARPSSPFLPECQARLSIRMNWLPEAMRNAAAMKKTAFPSLGMDLQAFIHRSQGDYFQAQSVLEELVQIDSFDIRRCLALLDCYDKTGATDLAEQLLTRAIALYPNKSTLKLRLAEIVLKSEGPARALPYLTAALHTAPANPEALKALGLAYHRLGRKTLALHYLDRAVQHDPDNHALREYVEILHGNGGENEKYADATGTADLAYQASRYREEPAVILLDETIMSVNTDGSFERRVRKVMMVNDRDEIRAFNTQYIVYDPDIESAENVSCAVVHHSLRSEITERYRKSLSQPDSGLYYNCQALIIPVSPLEPGDIIDLRYVIKNRGGGEYLQYFGAKITAGGIHRTMRFRTVLIHPPEKPIYCHLKGIDQRRLSIDKTGQKTVYRVALDDTAPVRKERAMPDVSQLLPAVYFTSHRNWDDFSRWYRSLVRDTIIVDSDMKSALGKIVSGTQDPLERISAIYRFVSDSIRYVGFEFGVGSIRPRRTDVTYHTGMGDCKDMSLLLVALMREAGIDARLALIRTRDKGAPHLAAPFAGEFNHAICYVGHGGGFFIDATASRAGIREIPADDRGTTALVVDDAGGRFISTGGVFYHRDRVDITSTATITPAGKAVIRRTMVKQGSSAPPARDSLRDPARHRDELHAYWNRSFPGSAVSEVTVMNAKIDEPVRYGYTVSIPGYPRAAEGIILFDACPSKSGLYQTYAITQSRAYPVVIAGAGTIVMKTSFMIPGGYRAGRLPENEKFTRDTFSAAFTYSAAGGTVSVESNITIRTDTVSSTDYQEFRNFTRFVDRKERERIILVPVSP